MEASFLILCVKVIVLDVLDQINRYLFQNWLNYLAVIVQQSLDNQDGLRGI